MAEAVLLPLAKSTLQQLSSPVLKEFLLLWNSEKELKKLETTVKTITLVLEDAEQRQSSDHLVRGWLAKLRAVMYDVEDLFDGVMAAALRKNTMTSNAFTKEVLLFFSKSNQLGFIFKTAHQVKAIRESLDDIARDMGQFHFISNPPVDKPVRLLDREATHSSIQAKDVIGRDQERDDIIKMLLLEDIGEKSIHQAVSVVAIIGFGGLGKTTLAKYVYNDDRVVKGGFELRLWVCLNYLSNLEQVLIEIMGSIGEKPSNLSLEGLKDRLIEIIGGKKFLVVLDDVWDEDDSNWHKLKPLLDYGKGGSQVLVTTRSNTVARCLGTSKQFQLSVLLEDYAWSFFVEMAFGEGEIGRHPELEPLGRQIIDRCGRVPLALAVVGRVLRRRDKDESTWSQFLDNELGEVLSNDDQNKIMQVLMVSYNDLPTPLKHCFASCSLYPKDYKFDKDELIRLWIGQGFIRPSNSKWSMEEMGERYFFQLVDRCFFQEVEEKVIIFKDTLDVFSPRVYVPNGHMAKVHDLLHDLAIYVVGTESKYLNVSDGLMNRDSLRHIGINRSLGWSFDRVINTFDPKMVRTILSHEMFVHGIETFARFKMLRTLEISNSVIKNIPDSIGELIFLRYLNLSDNEYINHLPSSTCKLQHLMILVLERCVNLKNLPSNIGKLVSLRQLLLDGCHELASFPAGLASLTSLVNLDPVIVHRLDGGLRYLNNLNNLRGIMKIRLPREGWSNAFEDAKKSNMAGKNKLRGMFLSWDESSQDSFERNYNMVKEEANAVLEALEPHKYLEYLNIRKFGGDKLSSWVHTHHIKELYLYECDVEYIEDESNCNVVSFPSLKILEFKGLRNLKGWWRHVATENEDQISRQSCLPNVVKVVIQDCEELIGRMPLFGKIESLVLKEVDEKLVRELLNILNANHTCSRHYHMLKTLSLRCIRSLSSLPVGWIGHLTSLQSLQVFGIDMRWVSSRGLAHLSTLEILELGITGGGSPCVAVKGNKRSEVGMPWKALQRLRVLACEVTHTQVEEGLQYLTSLENLNIVISNPPVDEGNVELPLIALEKLRSLQISCRGWGKLSLDDGIQYLHYLEKLTITDCSDLHLNWKAVLLTKKLVSVSIHRVGRVINVEDVVVVVVEGQQSHLRWLSIYSSKVELEHDMPWTLLGSLQRLDLSNIKQMEQLPDGIQHLSSLRDLTIKNFDKLTSLPNWMSNLTSLQHLSILECSEELKHRCAEASGEDWHLISHVPNKSIHSRNRTRSALLSGVDSS